MKRALDTVETQPAESAAAEEVVEWGLERFGDRIAISTSFQASGMALLDMAARISQGKVRVFTLDTGRMPKQTYELMQEVRRRYGISIEAVFPDSAEVSAMVSRHGPNLFYDSVGKRKLCCEIRKVRPLERKLAELDAWMVGLRRAQAETRQSIRKVDIDTGSGGIYKLCPLADWSQEQVWAYIRENDVPYHELYWQGYPTIGCAPCTRATASDEHHRAGRWWWETEADKECGIHVSPSGQVQREVDVLLDEVLAGAK